MLEVFVRYAHFLGILVLMSTLVVEHLLISPQMTKQELKKLARIDGIYGLAAVITLVAGLSLWFWVGKTAEFYSKNWVFHLKVTLFVLVGLLSIYPTIFFIKKAKSPDKSVLIPKKVVMFIRLELMLVLIIPLLAVIMSRGIGLN